MRLILLTLAMSLCFLPLSATEVDSPEQYVEARLKIMKYIGTQMRTLGNIQRGRSDFNPEYVGSAMGAIATMSETFKLLFPENSFIPPSDALEDIVGNEEFISILNQLRDAATQVSVNPTEEVFSEAFSQMGGACSSCHRQFRDHSSHSH